MANEMKNTEIVETKAVAVANQGNSVFTDDGFDLAVDLTTAKSQFCTLIPATDDEKAKLYNATNNPDFRLADFIGKTISMKDVYIEVVECVNKESGEIQTCPRIVILDKDLKGYACVSVGIYSSIKKIFQYYGTPNKWEKPLDIEIKQISKAERKMLSINVVTK